MALGVPLGFSFLSRDGRGNRHGAFCFGYAAHAVWTWGFFIWSWGFYVLAMGLLREEVRPDAADGTAGEEAAESTCDKRPRRFRHRFQHLRPVEIQFHFCRFLSLVVFSPRNTRKDFVYLVVEIVLS